MFISAHCPKHAALECIVEMWNAVTHRPSSYELFCSSFFAIRLHIRTEELYTQFSGKQRRGRKKISFWAISFTRQMPMEIKHTSSQECIPFVQMKTSPSRNEVIIHQRPGSETWRPGEMPSRLHCSECGPGPAASVPTAGSLAPN